MDYMRIAKKLIKKHEGLRLKPYRCPAGKLTIGYGRNLDDVGISEGEAEVLLTNDISRAIGEAQILAGHAWVDLSDNRKAVLVDMVFNLGLTRLSKFYKFLAALREGDYATAAKEMLNSKWAKQVGRRAITLAYIMEHDKLPQDV